MNALVKTEPKLMLLDYMADKYSLLPDEFSKTVKATCGLATATNEQFAAFLIVAKTYDLNPLTKEIYAFPGKGGGIVPIVSIDGWVNLVNSNPNCDGFQFDMEHSLDGKLIACTCTMHRKDRTHPVSVTEYLTECRRPTEPWKMEHRMLRHKAMIQAARYAFGFAGIYDEDEGRTIAETDGQPRDSGPPRGITIEHRPVEEPSTSPTDATVTALPPANATTAPPAKPISQAIKPTEGPHKIIGGTYASWADNYIEAIGTAGDEATFIEWVNANTAQLEKLAKGSPADATRVKTSVDKHLAFLRRTEPKKDPISTGKPKVKKAKEPPSFDKDYDGWLKYFLDLIAKVPDADRLDDIFAQIDDRWADLIPPDKDALLAARREAEDRLEQ